MKRIGLILIIILAIILIIPKEDEELRIRVIANSNSSIDQKIKIQVVNTIMDEIKDYDSENLKNEIKNNLPKIQNKVKIILKDKNFEIDIKNVRFPPKTLNDKIIPGGVYETLLVVIEDGQGKNWWSLLYPEYHGISFEDVDAGEVEVEFFFFEKLKKILK